MLLCFVPCIIKQKQKFVKWECQKDRLRDSCLLVLIDVIRTSVLASNFEPSVSFVSVD